jgi:hypothetical protein
VGVEGVLLVTDGWVDILKKERDRTTDLIELLAKKDLVPIIFAA